MGDIRLSGVEQVVDMNPVYLVTGGTSGIGEAVVRKIMEETEGCGATVLVTYAHNDDAAAVLRESFPSCEQSRLHFFKVDLSQRENILHLVGEIKKLTKHLEGAVLNVGVGTYKPFSEYSFEDWDRVIETNLTIPVFTIQSFLVEGLLDGSSVLLVGSLAGSIPYSSSVAYGISKAGLLFAARTLVKELEHTGSRINAVAPGFIETRWQDGRSEESRNRINAKIAAHRFGLPGEVADAVYSTMVNSYINGTILNIDGGYGYF